MREAARSPAGPHEREHPLAGVLVVPIGASAELCLVDWLDRLPAMRWLLRPTSRIGRPYLARLAAQDLDVGGTVLARDPAGGGLALVHHADLPEPGEGCPGLSLPTKALDILVAARALIADPARWAQGALARDAAGLAVAPSWPQAVCFCANGSLLRVGGNFGIHSGAHRCLFEAARVLFEKDVAWVNDRQTHADVLAMFDAAIEEAGREAQGAGCAP